MVTFMLRLLQTFVTDANGDSIQILGPGQEFLSLVIGSSFMGIGLALVFLHNGSTGGTDIVAACVNKFKAISLGRVLIAIDFCIIGSSYFIWHDPRMLVLGLCTMVICNFMIDYVMNARRESVQFLIFSKEYEKIASAIGHETAHGVTILDGHGWYTGKEVKVLCVLAKKRESVSIFRVIKSIDPDAFVSQSSVIGVYGQGFDEMKVKVKKK